MGARRRIVNPMVRLNVSGEFASTRVGCVVVVRAEHATAPWLARRLVVVPDHDRLVRRCPSVVVVAEVH